MSVCSAREIFCANCAVLTTRQVQFHIHLYFQGDAYLLALRPST